MSAGMPYKNQKAKQRQMAHIGTNVVCFFINNSLLSNLFDNVKDPVFLRGLHNVLLSSLMPYRRCFVQRILFANTL